MIKMTINPKSGGVLRSVPRISGWVFCLGAIALSATPLRAQIAVNRIEIAFQAKAFDSRLGTIVLTNEGKVPVQAQVKLEDWDRAENGANRWYAYGTLPGSCGKLLQIFPASVRLEPGASQAVRLTMDSTQSAPTKECWAAAMVETLQPRVEASGSTVTYAVRTAVKVYVMPPNQAVDGELTDLVIAPDTATKSDALEVLFENTGGQHLITKGTVEFRRADNSVASKLDVPLMYTLPGARSRARLAVPKLPAGKYIALAVLDYGGDKLAAAQFEFEAR